MHPLLLLLLATAGLASTASSHDVPLTEEIGTVSTLQRLEERQLQLSARMEVLTHTVDTQLAQLDNSMLQLYKELGSSRLQETLAELRQAAVLPNLTDVISSQLQRAELQLQSQLNDTQHRLTSLLEEARPPAEPATAAATTIVVEKCSYQDQFQTLDEWRPADCADVQQRHQRSGVYTIFPTVCGNGGGIRVFCDMDTDGGGWTVLMRRADVPVHQDFNMGWQSYKWGFGNLSGEFWLGNEYMSLLTSMEQMQLRVDLGDWENGTAFAKYTPFSVGSEIQKYVLTIGKYEGTAGNSMAHNNGGKFSTKEQDNDVHKTFCARDYQGAGWHRACFHQNLLGPYQQKTLKKGWIGVVWKDFKGEKYSLKHVELKMRPVNYMTWCHKLAREGVSE